MKHTDYCRQFLQWASRQPTLKAAGHTLCDLIMVGQKFLLPEGGVLLDDTQLRAIDEKLRLSLPFPITVLEFLGAQQRRHIVVLRETDTDIEIYPVYYSKKTNEWLSLEPIRMNRDRYVEREDSGRVALFCSFPSEAAQLLAQKTHAYSLSQYVFLTFINAMSCRNVRAERSPASPFKRSGVIKSSRTLPYDDYHVLTMSTKEPGKGGVSRGGAPGTHASPREHLRRGHIVRAKSGAYWRNAMVVMPGNGGKITKTYQIRV